MASYEPAKSSRNGFQSPDAVKGSVNRRDQQTEQMNRLAINRVKLDAARKLRQCPDNPLDTGVDNMRNGHTPANTGGAEALALQDRRHDALEVASV